MPSNIGGGTKFAISESKGGSYGHRLWVHTGESIKCHGIPAIPGREVLDALSMWGGSDKSGKNFMSWELPGDLSVSYLIHVLSHLGFSYKPQFERELEF